MSTNGLLLFTRRHDIIKSQRCRTGEGRFDENTVKTKGNQIMQNFGENLKKYRKEAKISQDELASRMGITPQAVSKWECGLSYPDITLIVSLADLFGITADELLRGVGTAKEISSTTDEYIEDCDGILADDGVIRIVMCEGRRVLRAEEAAKREPILIKIEKVKTKDENSIFHRLFEKDGKVELTVYGNAEVDGDVNGPLTAGGAVSCGEVNGNVDAGGGVSCGEVNGSVDAKGHVSCGEVNGHAHANGHLTCGDVNGNVDAGGEVNCGDVEGNVNAKGNATCGDVGGDVVSEGEVNCGDIDGDVAVRNGSVTCGDIDGAVASQGEVICEDIDGDVTTRGNVTCSTVEGDVTAESVTCDTIEGDVTVGNGSVVCSMVEGDVTCKEGSVECETVEGDVKANTVTCERIEGDVEAQTVNYVE